MGSQTGEQGSDFTLGLQIALTIIFLGNLEPKLHALDELLGSFFGPWLFKLGILLLPGLLKLDPLRNIESI